MYNILYSISIIMQAYQKLTTVMPYIYIHQKVTKPSRKRYNVIIPVSNLIPFTMFTLCRSIQTNTLDHKQN